MADIKRGIFGGTFNPIHNGHINLALSVMKKANVDVLTVIPAGNPYHKSGDGLINIEHRINMCRLAFMDYDNIEISSIEVGEDISYTCSTLHKIKAEYPEDSIVLFIGSDMFLNFNNWKNSKQILQNATLACVMRSHVDRRAVEKKALEYRAMGGEVEIIDVEIIDISSTEIRDNIKDFKSFVPSCIYEYILQNNLYDNLSYDYLNIILDLENSLSTMLNEKRLTHSRNVAKEAVILAEKYDVDKTIAYIAGLTHDICKQISYDEMLQWILKSDIIWDSAMLKQKGILHGLAAAEYLWYEKKLFNVDIINAVRYHTIGREKMSQLEKLIYIADLTCQDRDYPNVELMRSIGHTSLDEGMKYALKYIVVNLVSRGLPICSFTAECYNYYNI